jgi:hypothetical protein
MSVIWSWTYFYNLLWNNYDADNHRHLFHSTNICPSSSLLQGKHLPFTPSPLCLNIFRLFVILSLTQLYLYTPEIFLFSTATLWKIQRKPEVAVSVSMTEKSWDVRWIFLSNSSEGGPIGIFKCGSRKQKYLGSVTI